MKWTRKKPTIPGHYWFRGYGRTNIVVIAFHPSAPVAELRVCVSHAGEYGTAISLYLEKDCEWSDTPVQQPAE